MARASGGRVGVHPARQESVQPVRGLGLPKLLAHIEAGDIDPSFVVTHRVALEDAPEMYKTFRDKKDGCIKVVMRPH